MKFPISNFQFPNRAHSGFTIVELLVAMGIFVTVIGIVVGIFISSLRAERSLVGLISINDNVSLALEQMAREIRTGEEFAEFNLGEALVFKNAQGFQVAYRVDNGALERGTCPDITCSNLSEFENYIALTGNKALVDRLLFVVDEGFATDPWPPRIIVRLGVTSTSPDTSGSRTDIQTTISARGN